MTLHELGHPSSFDTMLEISSLAIYYDGLVYLDFAKHLLLGFCPFLVDLTWTRNKINKKWVPKFADVKATNWPGFRPPSLVVKTFDQAPNLS